MEHKYNWFWWIFGLAINAWLTLTLARAVGIPIWVAVIFLLVMEISPALWVLGLIHKTNIITQDLIGGFWVIMQMIVFLFDIVVLMSLPSLLTDWGIVLKIVLIPLSGAFMYLRTRSTVTLIQNRGY